MLVETTHVTQFEYYFAYRRRNKCYLEFLANIVKNEYLCGFLYLIYGKTYSSHDSQADEKNQYNSFPQVKSVC